MQRLVRVLAFLTAVTLNPLVQAQNSSDDTAASAFAAFTAARANPGPVYRAPSGNLLAPQASRGPAGEQAREQAREQAMRVWKRSVVAVAGSQALDVASSYGMRELNPLLAGADGRFGAQAVAIKGGAAAAILGVEYLLASKYPRAARVLAKLNWSTAVVTSAFAVHNFAIR